MDIKRWRVMLAVDDYGSFTRAGEELGYTQSGITQMMKALEKDVGFSLFIKGQSRNVPDSRCQSVNSCNSFLLNADEVIRQEIASLKGAQVGTIKIGTYLSCSIHWIPKIIREFKEKHPDIHFKIVEGVEGELADWIQERRVDIGFISYQRDITISSFRSWMTSYSQFFRQTTRLPPMTKYQWRHSRASFHHHEYSPTMSFGHETTKSIRHTYVTVNSPPHGRARLEPPLLPGLRFAGRSVISLYAR